MTKLTEFYLLYEESKKKGKLDIMDNLLNNTLFIGFYDGSYSYEIRYKNIKYYDDTIAYNLEMSRMDIREFNLLLKKIRKDKGIDFKYVVVCNDGWFSFYYLNEYSNTYDSLNLPDIWEETDTKREDIEKLFKLGIKALEEDK